MNNLLSAVSNATRSLLVGALVLAQACAPGPEDDVTPAEPKSGLDGIAQALKVPVSGTLPTNLTIDGKIPAPAGADFAYYEVAGTYCRDGSRAGVSVRSSAKGNKNILVYLQGGGACFDTQTCAANAASVTDTHRVPDNNGIFHRTDQSNPFLDWNIVYVPYCTGDFHLGNKTSDVGGPSPKNQKFVGRANLELILQYAVKTFPPVTDVTQELTKLVLVGSSAGGGGATGNVVPVKRAFGVDKMWLIDDAGPLLSSGALPGQDYMPGAQQLKWSALWGMDTTVLADCGAFCAGTNNFLPLIAKFAPTVIGRKAAFTGGKQDLNIAALYTQARIDQYGALGAFGFDTRKALNDFRARMGDSWWTYFVTTPDNDAQKHMRLPDPDFFYTNQTDLVTGNPVFISDWVKWYINDDKQLNNVGP